jgi:hypothetical protein
MRIIIGDGEAVKGELVLDEISIQLVGTEAESLTINNNTIVEMLGKHFIDGANKGNKD